METRFGNKLERPNTIAGLLDKRAEYAARIKALQGEMTKAICDLDHLDAAIRIFDENADVSRIKRYPTKHRAFKGEMRRFVLNALREAKQPINSLEITEAILVARKLKADHATVVMIRKRVGACLTALKRNGIIEAVPQPGEYKWWRLRPPETPRVEGT